MNRALLLTVSDDMSSSWGMRFVSDFFRNKQKVHCTLLYVVPPGYAADESELGITLSAGQLAKGHETVGLARDWLVARGFPESGITAKVLPAQYGIVRDIALEATRGLYDAVVVGRRYLDWMQRLYTTSVSRGILWENGEFPVWVCNQPESGRRHVLLCADGSEAASHMADHVGFMMDHEPDLLVTVLHLRTDSPRSDVRAAEALEQARNCILHNGISESRISTLVTDAADKVETIVRLAHDGNYAVVAVGRRPDLPESLARRLFAGSVSLGLHENVARFSLWVGR